MQYISEPRLKPSCVVSQHIIEYVVLHPVPDKGQCLGILQAIPQDSANECETNNLETKSSRKTITGANCGVGSRGLTKEDLDLIAKFNWCNESKIILQ